MERTPFQRWVLALCILTACIVMRPAAASARSSDLGQPADSAAVFYVEAGLFQDDGVTPWVSPDTLQMQNARNALVGRDVIGRIGRGKWAAVLIDFQGNAAVNKGDSLSFVFADTTLRAVPPEIFVDGEMIVRGAARVTLRVTTANSQVEPVVTHPSGLFVWPNPADSKGARIAVFDGAAGEGRGLQDVSRGELQILDVTGRKHRSLALQRAPGGFYSDWDARDDAGHRLPVGVYWVRWEGLRSGEVGEARVVLVR